MRLWILLGLSVLIAVALAAWFLLGGEPRGRGDAVSGAAPVAPAPASAPGAGPDDLAPEAPADAPAPEPGAAREAAAPPRAERGRAVLPADSPRAAAPPILDALRGHLRSESGGWNDLSGLLRGGVVVEVVSLADPGFSRRAVLEAVEERDGSTAIAFRCEGLPRGTYRLTVSSLVAEVWEPRELTLDTPVDDVEVWCRDRIDRVRLEFAVVDADSGEALEAFEVMSLRQTVSQTEGVFFHAGDLQREAFPVDGRLDWSLSAPDHAPAFGDERSFQPGPDGTWVARVALRRGWGARVVVLARDPGMRPIEGAQVLVDGAYAGQTGARGWLDVERATAPARLTVQWNGLERSLEAPRAPDSSEARRRGQLLPVVLE